MRVIIFICLFFIKLFAQNISVLEQKYSILDKSLKEAVIKLDSLSQILEKKANLIDREKKKSDPEIDKITGLMAETIVIASQVEEQQKKIKQLQGSINFLKQNLYKKYSVLIDSLKRVENSKVSGESKSELEKKILYLAQKRLYLSPNIPLLSFSPDKILNIDLNATEDSLEKAIYQEYLKHALSEVDSHLVELSELSSEINEMILLQKKTESFMDEMDFEGTIERYYSINHEKGMSPEPSSYISEDEQFRGEDITAMDEYISSNMSLLQSYYPLLNNLLLHRSYLLPKTPDVQVKWQALTDSTKENLSIDSYQALLQEVEKALSEYKMILLHKLEGLKERVYPEYKKNNSKG
jgi:hypothetical protein